MPGATPPLGGRPVSPERVATSEVRPIYRSIAQEKSRSLKAEKWSDFTERELTVIAIIWLNSLTSNGGFASYLWSVSDEMSRIAGEALLRISAPRCAQILEEADQVFREKTGSRPADLKDLDHKRLNSLSDQFFVLIEGENGWGGEEGIMQLLLKYWRETDNGNSAK